MQPKRLLSSSLAALLGYTPANSAPNEKYRSIKVSVNRPDVTVLARKGYLAEKPHGR